MFPGESFSLTKYSTNFVSFSGLKSVCAGSSWCSVQFKHAINSLLAIDGKVISCGWYSYENIKNGVS